MLNSKTFDEIDRVISDSKRVLLKEDNIILFENQEIYEELLYIGIQLRILNSNLFVN